MFRVGDTIRLKTLTIKIVSIGDFPYPDGYTCRIVGACNPKLLGKEIVKRESELARAERVA
jgi:hypothetical protein